MSADPTPANAARLAMLVAELKSELVSDALGYLWTYVPARRAEIETLCKRAGLMITVDE